MAKEDLTWANLGDILCSTTVAAQSSIRLPTQNIETPTPVIKSEPSEVRHIYEGNRQGYHR